MEFNKSQLLIAGTIVTSMLGFPNINKVFTEEIIRVALIDSTLTAIIIISILKIALALSSIAWLFQLLKNIEFTYQFHSEDIFNIYMLKLVITAIITFIIMRLILS